MKTALFCFGIAFVFVLALGGDALAGQFKTMASVPNGGTLYAYSSPMSFGPAMEMEVFEFLSTSVADNYRCRIVQNRTNRPLTIRLIGVNGTVVGSCTAPTGGGSCVTPTFSLVPNLKFFCLVSTYNPAPVALGGWYQMGVQRP